MLAVVFFFFRFRDTIFFFFFFAVIFLRVVDALFRTRPPTQRARFVAAAVAAAWAVCSLIGAEHAAPEASVQSELIALLFSAESGENVCH